MVQKSQVKIGAIFSYFLIFLNLIYGFVISPYILRKVGVEDYGVYKTISSFTAAFMVVDLGIGNTMMRYIAKFRSDKEDSRIPNYIAMCLMQIAVIVAALSVIMFVLYFNIDHMFSKGLASSEIIQAKKLFVFLSCGLCLHIIENFFNGIVSGYNNFIFGNGVRILRLILRSLLIVVLLNFYGNTIIITLIDIFVTIFILTLYFVFVRKKINIKIKYEKWDSSLFVESFKYTGLMFLTSIAVQVASNLDNVVIGAISGSVKVAIYSYALLFFSMFQELSTAISGVMLPTVINVLANDDDKYTKTQNIIVRAGRVQFALLGAAVCGFVIIGKEFIHLWLGDGFEDIYVITLILMLPAILELCINVCLSVLRAENKLGFRTIVLFISTILNALITVIGTYYWNYYAAAIGTGFSFFFGSVLVMGIYYYKKFNFNILKMYLKIVNRLWICILLSGISGYFVSAMVNNAFLKVGICIIVFVLVYGITLLLFGLDADEKNELRKIFRI